MQNSIFRRPEDWVMSHTSRTPCSGRWAWTRQKRTLSTRLTPTIRLREYAAGARRSKAEGFNLNTTQTIGGYTLAANSLYAAVTGGSLAVATAIWQGALCCARDAVPGGLRRRAVPVHERDHEHHAELGHVLDYVRSRRRVGKRTPPLFDKKYRSVR
jgi:hypothetical protein